MYSFNSHGIKCPKTNYVKNMLEFDKNVENKKRIDQFWFCKNKVRNQLKSYIQETLNVLTKCSVILKASAFYRELFC